MLFFFFVAELILIVAKEECERKKYHHRCVAYGISPRSRIRNIPFRLLPLFACFLRDQVCLKCCQKIQRNLSLRLVCKRRGYVALHTICERIVKSEKITILG